MKNSALIFFVLTACALGGCTFSRSVVNPHYTGLDTSWIVPGKTTREEVVEKLGMPSSAMHGRGGVGRDTLRWITSDTFTSTLEAGYIVTPTFQVSKERHSHDILVKFDSHGVVELLSRTLVVGGTDERRILEWKEAPK